MNKNYTEMYKNCAKLKISVCVSLVFSRFDMICDLKSLSAAAIKTLIFCYQAFASSPNIELNQNIYVHVASYLEQLNSNTFRLPLDKFYKSRYGTLGENFKFISTKEWEAFWLVDPAHLGSLRNENVTFAWLEFNEMKYAEVIITHAKISEDRKFVDYEVIPPLRDNFLNIGFAAMLFDPANSGACALSVLEDAQVDGLNDALLAGAGVAALDCLLEDYISVIVNPAIKRRVSPFYGYVLKTDVSN